MRFHGIAAGVMGLCLLSLAASLQAAQIIEDTFTGYPDNALISADPAGPANGLSGNWTLVPDSNFYVNKTLRPTTMPARAKPSTTGLPVTTEPAPRHGTPRPNMFSTRPTAICSMRAS